jgi:hypothetical protein
MGEPSLRRFASRESDHADDGDTGVAVPSSDEVDNREQPMFVAISLSSYQAFVPDAACP